LLKKILFLLLLLYSVVGFFVLPWVAKSQIVKLVAQETNAKLRVESIYFNPFLFKLKFHNLQLTNTEDKPLIGFKTFSVDLELYSLFTGNIHIKNILLQKPELFVVLSKEKKLNLLGILKESPKKKKSSKAMKLPRILIDKIRLLEGNVEYEDYTKNEKFAFDFHNIHFSVENIDTKNIDSNKTHLNFYTGLGDGGRLEIQTQIKSLTPLLLDGHLSLQANKLYTPWKYVKDMLNLEVADGKVSLKAHFHFNADDFNATVADSINMNIDKLRIVPQKGYRDIVTLHNFAIQNASVKPFEHDIHIDTISLENLHVDAKRNKKSQIDFLQYVKLNTEKKATKKLVKTPIEKKPWSISLKELDLKNISANFEDKGVSPQVRTKLNALNIYAKDITLAGEKPFAYRLSLLLNDSFRCQAEGFVQHKVLDINTHVKCENFDFVHYRPYIDKIARDALQVYDVKLRSATASLDTKIHLKEEKKKFLIQVSDTNASVQKLRITKRRSPKTLLAFNACNVSNVSLDVSKKKLTIGKVSLVSPQIHAILNKKGILNFDNLIVPKKSKSKKKKEKPFGVYVKHFALYNAKVDFKDATLSPSLTNTIDKINLHLYNVNAKRNTWLSYKLSSRVNFKGNIKAKGKLRHTPLKEKGKVQLTQISLKNLTPYIQKKAFIKVADGKLFVDAKTEYGASKTQPDLKVEGKISLKDFFLNDSRDDASVFSINDVNVSAFTFEYNPNRLYIDELALKSFYIDAQIDKNKEMNYLKLLKPSEQNSTQELNASQETNATQFPIKIAKVSIRDGNAKFADFSIPLQFKTDIHSLNGAVYSVSNDANETSYVNIDGEVDKYGSTKLKGSVNSANPKEFMDLNFNFKNLSLHSLSGYSANFAGYEIEQGKLYLDLDYKIKNSQMLGKNKIMIKNMKLGKENPDANVTKLPLGFAIGLLEDSDGVIDIEMPVEGNVDAPDFKYGTLVWKAFGNLIVKAVSAPFRFLGSLLGMDSATLEYVEFEAGRSNITPTQREKLDNIVKILQKRPKVELQITPMYDAAQDKKAIQKKKLVNLVMKKSGITNEKEHQSAMTVDMLESIYMTFGDEKHLKKLQEETQKRDYLQSLIAVCIELQSVSQIDLEDLAQQRATVIENYLVQEKGVEKSKISKEKMQVIENSEENGVKIGLHIEVK